MILVRRPSHRLSPAARAAIVSIGALALSWSAAVPAQDAPAAETEEAASDAPSPEAAAVDAASPPEERSSAAILPGGAAVPPRSATVGSAGQAKPSAVVGGTKATASLPQSTDENRERARIGAAARSDASSSSPAPSASGEEIEDRAIEDRMRELRDELRRLEDVFRTLQEERRAGGEESGYGAARETYRRAKSRYGRASEGYRSANPAIEGRLADEDGRRYDIRIAGDRVTASDPDTGKTLWTTALDGDMRQIRLTSRGDSLLLSTPKKTVTIDLSNGRLAVEENGVSVLPRSTTRRPEADRERRRAPQNAVPGRARRTVAPGGSGLGEPAGSGVGIDLVELANALIEAEGALELAKVERSNLERKVERGIVDRGDVRAAEVRIETAQRKVDLLRRMARSAHTRTRSEMALLRELQETADARYRSGQGTQEAVIDAKVRLARAEMAADLLEHILGSARN